MTLKLVQIGGILSSSKATSFFTFSSSAAFPLPPFTHRDPTRPLTIVPSFMGLHHPKTLGRPIRNPPELKSHQRNRGSNHRAR
ncbi:hypothetical protein Poly24_36110 [Rosistilla carotiformis]|uniref:Uncharacterized protein n=1 Tax=Rosistilla carotiformis TaxID=2528017 RepID=A0A518JWI4_9BACT|nr:hypothetical protein Poly24_36110 [Rosistilla carotiformis]